jgi:hypothetical protein
MAKREPARGDGGSEQRTGGVHISGSEVHVGGDVVGGNKITVTGADREYEQLFEQLRSAIESTRLPVTKKRALRQSSDELEVELRKPEPDLGTIQRLKQLLIDHGEGIAATATAIFQYPPVSTALRAALSRVLGV